jgi:hypothetical protein
VSKGHGSTIDVVRNLGDSLFLSSSTQNAIVCLWRLISRDGAQGTIAETTTATGASSHGSLHSLGVGVSQLEATRPSQVNMARAWSEGSNGAGAFAREQSLTSAASSAELDAALGLN